MKSLKHILRLWISFTSLFGFFGAWAMLAQSFRPVQAQPLAAAATAYPTLAVLNPINLNSAAQPNVNLQVVTPIPTPIPIPQPQPVFQQPLLRTGGSG